MAATVSTWAPVSARPPPLSPSSLAGGVAGGWLGVWLPDGAGVGVDGCPVLPDGAGVGFVGVGLGPGGVALVSVVPPR